MPFPKKRPEEKMRRLSTTLRPQAWEKLRDTSRRTGIPMSIILSDLIEKHLESDLDEIVKRFRGAGGDGSGPFKP